MIIGRIGLVKVNPHKILLIAMKTSYLKSERYRI